MSMRLAPALLVAVLLAGCASNLTPPSLAPRAAEKIDPRIPVVDNSAALLADPALVAELRAAEARASSAALAAIDQRQGEELAALQRQLR
jgi:hypothetical protein